MKGPLLLRAWPDVPTRVLVCRDYGLLRVDWRRVVVERLGLTPDEIDGEHRVALSRRKEFADRLLGFLS